ncbi:MAG: hypothetical protein D6760_13060 [Deltaproteobacteria bacterium]|nr:MAG: hypothetical protein D6760_13060 [Deltaproteobacteria bacterium]
MFVTLLIVTFAIAFATSLVVVRLFRAPIRMILDRVVSSELSGAWHRYLDFAVVVVGVSGGVRIWELEKYITARVKDMEPVVLNSDRWVLEVYRTLIGTLQSAAWLLLVFFVFALIAYVIVRGFELKRQGGPHAG